MPRIRLLSLHVESLADFARVGGRQGFFAAASRHGFVVSLAGDGRDGAVAVNGAVAEGHGL